MLEINKDNSRIKSIPFSSEKKNKAEEAKKKMN